MTRTLEGESEGKGGSGLEVGGREGEGGGGGGGKRPFVSEIGEQRWRQSGLGGALQRPGGGSEGGAVRPGGGMRGGGTLHGARGCKIGGNLFQGSGVFCITGGL